MRLWRAPHWKRSAPARARVARPLCRVLLPSTTLTGFRGRWSSTRWGGNRLDAFAPFSQLLIRYRDGEHLSSGVSLRHLFGYAPRFPRQPDPILPIVFHVTSALWPARIADP